MSHASKDPRVAAIREYSPRDFGELGRYDDEDLVEMLDAEGITDPAAAADWAYRREAALLTEHDRTVHVVDNAFENRCTIVETSHAGDVRERHIFAHPDGGYVRESTDYGDVQLCKGLRPRGMTLEWDPKAHPTLADLIRKELFHPIPPFETLAHDTEMRKKGIPRKR